MIPAIFHAVSHATLRLGAAFMLVAGVVGFRPGEYANKTTAREKPDITKD